jgi:hypothetical protein
MKTRQFFRPALLFAAFLLLCMQTGFRLAAQVIMPPAMPDNFVGPCGYSNNANVEYSPFGGLGMHLSVIVSDGGPGSCSPPMLYFNDQATGLAWTPFPIPAPPGSSPDVIIGNDIFAPGNYVIDVVATVPCGAGSNVMLFQYNAIGPSPYTVVPGPVFIISGGGCTVTGPAHIDIIGEYSTPFFGMPQADKFAVTWKDNVTGIMGYFAALSAPVPGVTAVINPGLNFTSPDVAAVERINAAGVFEDWALFSYVDQTIAPNQLWYQEWNMNPIVFPPSPPIPLDVTQNYINMGPLVSVERIDAIDDWTQNAPGGGNAWFDIVASVPLTGPPFGAAIYQYNSLNALPFAPFPPPALLDITSAVAGIAGQKNLVPVVAAGPGTGTFYSVGYFSGGLTQGYYVTAVDWTTGIPPVPPPGANAWQTNTIPFGPNPGFPYGIALSGTCNANNIPAPPFFATQSLLSSWESHGRLWEKSTVPAYAFKHNATSAPTVTADDQWSLSPNPATDHIVLTAPAGLTLNDGNTYEVKDLSGKTLLQSKITGATQEIGVNDLPAGMYLINIYANETNTKTIKFVKE